MYLLEKVLSPAEKNSSNRIPSDLSLVQRAILYGIVVCTHFFPKFLFLFLFRKFYDPVTTNLQVLTQ